MARTERESKRRRRKEKWQTCLCCQDRQRACKMAQASTEKLRSYWACRKGKSGLSAIEKAVGKYAGAAFAKKKRNRAICSDHQVVRWERVKVSESCTLAKERRGTEQEHGEERVDFTVKKGRFQEVEGGKAKRTFLGGVGESLSG